MFIDSRAGANKPAWMDATWVPSAAQNLFLAHSSPDANGPQMVGLGGNLNGGATGALRNYFAIIDQPAAVFEEGPISRFEFVHDRDQDGDGLHDEYEVVSGLSPWLPNNGGGAIPDEDKLTVAGATRFDDQKAFEAPAFVDFSSNSGGCGFTGLEPFALVALAGLLRRRRK